VHDLHWTEAIYVEDACDESWARLARSVCPRNEQGGVSLFESHVRQRPRTGDWRGLHLVAARARRA
jgi:hypothetical protein